MPLLSKASNVVQNVFFLYDVTGFTQIRHSIPVATSCTACLKLFRALSLCPTGILPPPLPYPAVGEWTA